ncbi:GNAT family N-acetyltransferase [Humidisolicoccus flavus]|uniref:GNAT family N-acetyltransferase n=1 Tax=Humidisolicoccus flavus TaxID=3111414 RepID=UPI00324C7849
MTVAFHDAPLAEISPVTLYKIMWMRVQVFVVEQAAAYAELDGRDLEPDAIHFWAEEDGTVLAALRLLVDEDALRIGRVATAEIARGRGLGADLMRRAVARCEQLDPSAAIVLDAQKHLADWYGRFGFEISGAEFAEDGIPHVPMRRPAARTSATA